MSDFLKELNPVQYKAVTKIEGPSLVIAGAGSGKTRVLTYRIAYLLSQGVPSYSILALTFTNKAAREMKERIGNLVGEDQARSLWMGTFHARFAAILRMEAEKLTYKPGFTIYDTVDSKNALKQIIKDLKLDEKIYKPSEVLGRISKAKNNLITAEAYLGNSNLMENDRQSRRPELGRIYKFYAARCRQSDAMDFDDILLNTNILFRDHPDVLEKYQQKFRYILVDEYQDTNIAQYLIIKKLAEKNKNICVVGDDAQSIYAFRGARIENILNFKKDYPEYQLFKLEQNYRSTQLIVKAANSLISKNKDQIQKKVFSKRAAGEKISLIQAFTDNEEGALVADSILSSHLSDRFKYKDVAILYRTNAQSRIFEEALRKLNIPYRIYGGISFYQRKEIKDVIAYLRLLVNPFDDESFRRVINYPARGIGKTTLGRLDQAAFDKGKSLWEISKGLLTDPVGLNKGTIAKIIAFTKLIEKHADGIENRDAFESAKNIVVEAGIIHDLHSESKQDELSKYENVQELLNGIKDLTQQDGEDKTVPLSVFLENVALLTDQDTDKEPDSDKVTLMTIHAAKGLEFELIYVVGVEEGLFPSERSAASQNDLEEERRLFYVAVTRAKERLHISYSKTRYKWGNSYDCKPSRFIREIDENYFEELPSMLTEENPFRFKPDRQESTIRFKPKYPTEDRKPNIVKPVVPSPKLKPLRKLNSESNTGTGNAQKIIPGLRVRHERFGEGKVLKIEGESPNQKATVFFNTAGQKQLLLKFARLEILP